MPHAYFPPLDKCLAGEERLLSWKLVHQTLCDPSRAVEETALEAFLTDDESIHWLSHSLDNLPSPSAKSKSDFETKTAPINVSQSANSEYSLDELKKDAQWLSEKLKIEENVALRTVILEWQSRQENALRVGSAASSSGISQVTGTVGNGLLASTNSSGVNAAETGLERKRRDRQIAIFLEEKSYALQTNAALVERFTTHGLRSEAGNTWLDELAARITKDECVGDEDATKCDAFCTRCTEVTEASIENLDDTSKWPESFKSDDETGLLYGAATRQDIVSTLRLLLANLHVFQRLPSSNLVTSWFKLMVRVSFFQDLASSFPETASLQCLVSTISLIILQLPDAMSHIQDLAVSTAEDTLYPPLPVGTYLHDDACVKEINRVLQQAAEQNISIAAPAIYAWSIITSLVRDAAKVQHELTIDEGSDDGEPRGRRASRRNSKDNMSFVESLYSLIQTPETGMEPRDDPPAFLAHASVDRMGIYSLIPDLCTTITSIYGSSWDGSPSFIARNALFDLVREGMPMVAYGAPVIESVLTILRPDIHGRSTEFDSQLTHRFLGDDTSLRPAILEQALSRYPYELTPLLRLLIVLSSASVGQKSADLPVIATALDDSRTLTVMVPETFKSYRLDHEDENVNSITLTQPLPLFVSGRARSLYGADGTGRSTLPVRGEGTEQQDIISIPSSAPGAIIKESKPFVFCMEHAHSGLGYLGLLLATLLPSINVAVPPLHTDLDRATFAEIIQLVTNLLRACLEQQESSEGALFVLARLSLALPEGRDIVSVIEDILEMELLAHLDQSAQESSLDLLIACSEFLDKLIAVAPERVWSMLTRSSLLGISGGANALATVVGGSEVTAGRFRFLTACVSIYSHLVTDAITGLAKRRARNAKPANRFDSPVSFQDATPDRTIRAVLSSYQTVMIDVWQSLSDWRFEIPVEKGELTTLILKAFEKLLHSSHGIGRGSGGITGLLIPASASLLEAFAPDAVGETALHPFPAILAVGLAIDDGHLPSLERTVLQQQVVTSLQFLAALIRTVRSVDETGTRASIVAAQLLNSMSLFASLLVADQRYKSALLAFLTEIVKAAHGTNREPPSLLGQLSTSTAKSFLSVVSHLDRPLCDIEVEATVWDLLSAVMSSKQQWFALYVLTGTLPKDRLKDDKPKDGTPKPKSLLLYALDQLSRLATLPPERASAMLKFISHAQNTWVWATHEVLSHPDFLKNSVDWLNKLQLPTRSSNIAEELLLANEHEMAASLCRILAVTLHASNEIGDKTLLKLIPSKLGFLGRHGVTTNAFKRSLHLNLKENFARRFPSCELADFTRTSANPAPFGRKYYYDLDLADEVLGHEPAWHGNSNGRNQGFSDEFARANVNLSLVEAQKRLLKSWQILATSLSECVGQDEALQVELANTAETCLLANADANLEEPGMDQVVNIRAEMAFLILTKLTSMKCSTAAMKKLLLAAWGLVRNCPTDYDVATSSQDIDYYRKLLQVLYLTIQPHIYTAPSSSSLAREPKPTEETRMDFLEPGTAACLVQIMERLIAPGFRALCGNLHDSVKFAEPKDFELITAVLQAALSVPGVAAVHLQFAETVANTNLVRGALSLYSWSDQLAEAMQQDPIYGEVAIMFLLSLSSIPPVAEHMALNGVLIQLSSANLSNYFRKNGGKGPFSEPRRMFVIWTEGFLPLCLNLLDAVGPPLAAEVSAFLNSYPAQLQRAETSLENREATRQTPFARAITLSLVSEAHNLCLIARILASDTARGAAEGIDAGDVPKLNYDEEKVGEYAAGVMRQKNSLASRVYPMSEREQMWMEGVQGDNIMLGKIVYEVKALLHCLGKDS